MLQEYLKPLQVLGVMVTLCEGPFWTVPRSR